MFKKIALALVAIVVLLVVLIATRPVDFHIVRSRQIAAPAPVVFGILSDFHHWSEWSPWDKLDPTMKRTFSGAPSGVGAQYAWVGNDKVGEGRMTIESSQAPSELHVKLEFLKPYASTNTITFTLSPAAGGTHVTWAMDGHNDFMGKAFGLVMNMDKMVGGDFEKGLASLDTAATAEAQRQAAEAAKLKAEEAAKAAAAAAAAVTATAPTTTPPPAK